MSSCYDNMPEIGNQSGPNRYYNLDHGNGFITKQYVSPSVELVAERLGELGRIAGGGCIKEVKQCLGCGATNYTFKQNKKVCEYCGNDQ